MWINRNSHCIFIVMNGALASNTLSSSLNTSMMWSPCAEPQTLGLFMWTVHEHAYGVNCWRIGGLLNSDQRVGENNNAQTLSFKSRQQKWFYQIKEVSNHHLQQFPLLWLITSLNSISLLPPLTQWGDAWMRCEGGRLFSCKWDSCSDERYFKVTSVPLTCCTALSTVTGLRL